MKLRVAAVFSHAVMAAFSCPYNQYLTVTLGRPIVAEVDYYVSLAAVSPEDAATEFRIMYGPRGEARLNRLLHRGALLDDALRETLEWSAKQPRATLDDLLTPPTPR